MERYKFNTERFGEIELESGMVLCSSLRIFILVEFPIGLCWIMYGDDAWDLLTESNINHFIEMYDIINIKYGTDVLRLTEGKIYAEPLITISKKEIAEKFGISINSLKIVD